MDETLVCDHSNKSYWAVLSCGTVYHAVQCHSNFKSCLKTNCEPRNRKHKTKLGSGRKGHRVISVPKSKMFKYFP